MTEYSNLQDTAYYVFDTRVFRQRIRHVRQLLGPDMALAYAIKANPFLTGFALGAAEKLEVCSPGECRICDALGIPAEATVISGLNKHPAFLEALISASDGRTYTVESLTQFATLDALAKKYGKRLPILLRLTNNSQFGINEEEILALVQSREEHPNLCFRGIQFFSGTQKTSIKKLAREIEHLDALLQGLEAETGWRCPELEYGPGFPVSYFGEELDEAALLTQFREDLESMAWRCNAGTGPVFGRFLRTILYPCSRPEDQPRPELSDFGRRYAPDGLLWAVYGHENAAHYPLRQGKRPHSEAMEPLRQPVLHE